MAAICAFADSLVGEMGESEAVTAILAAGWSYAWAHTYAGAHGLIQKVGDEWSGEKEIDDIVLTCDEIIGRLKKDGWTAEREAGDSMAGASIVIKALMEKANTFLIGGAMAYTFFRALGISTGKSRVEADKIDLAREILALAKAKGVRFLLPLDNLETQEISATAQPRPTGLLSTEKGISDDWEAVDIGPETISLYRQEIAGARTVLWNGPVGIFELAPFASGTRSIAEALAASSAVTIIGGGDSVTAVKQFGLGDKVSFCSTGGGASLELIEGKVLPGVAALSEKA
jgi:3-phosphoglycerate kinase